MQPDNMPMPESAAPEPVPQPAPQPQPPQERMYTKEEVNQMMRQRLKGGAAKKQKEMDEDDVQMPDMSQYVHVQDIPKILEQNAQKTKLIDKTVAMDQKIRAAAEKDPEFKELITGSKNELSQGDLIAISNMSMLPNLPAIVKDLLKNDQSYALFRSAIAESNFQKDKFLQELSEKLDANKMTKGTAYTPVPDIGGGADDDAAMAAINSYIKRR